MAQQPSTADYRKYPKGPNFKAVVVGFCVALLLVALIAVLVLRGAGKRIFPMKTNATPSQTLATPTPDLHQVTVSRATSS